MFNWKAVIAGLANGLMQRRQQTIIYSNDNQSLQFHVVSPIDNNFK